MTAFLLRFWKPLAGGLVVLVLIGGIWFAVDAYGDRREERVRQEWAGERAERRRVAEAAKAKADVQDAADAKRNEEIARDYEKRLAVGAAERDSLQRMLRDARARLGRRTEVPGEPGTPAACPPGEDGRLDAALAAALTEARANADQLDALIGQVTPQL